MFSFLWSKDEETKRLDAVEQIIDEHKEDVADANLEEIAKAAKELRAVMDLEIARGAHNTKLLKRIEDISDNILKNLEGRLTVDVLKGGKAVLNRFITIGKDLDAVRATKASSILEAHAIAVQEKLAEGKIKEVQAAVLEVKTPDESLVPNLQKALDAAAACNVMAPDSKRITDLLLRLISTLAQRLLQLAPHALTKDPSCANKMHEAADNLDMLAGKLVILMETLWDPPATPQLDTLVRNQTLQVFTTATNTMQAELAKGGDALNPAVFTTQLKALQPWWPITKSVDPPLPECGEKVQAVCESVDKSVVEFFEKAHASGMEGVTDALFTFAQEMDSITAKFDGIDIAESSLRSQLLGTGVFANAGKQVEQLSTELAKPGIEIATCNLALKTIEALVPLWTRSIEADEELPNKLGAALDALEGEILEAAPTAELDMAEAFMKFAIKYDEMRKTLSLEEHNFQEKLVPQVTVAFIFKAEDEIGKTEGRNSAALLKALQGLKDPALKSALEDEEIKARLLAALRATDQILLDAFKEAVENGEDKKAQALGNYAVAYDAVCADIEPDVPEGRCTVAKHMALLKQSSIVATEVARGADLDIDATIAALDALQVIFKACKGPEEIVEKFKELQAPLSEVLVAKETSADDDAEKNILLLAQKMAATIAAIEGTEVDEDSDKLCRTLKSMNPVMQFLRKAASELDKETGLNPMLVLSCLTKVKEKWEDVAHIEALQTRLVGVFSKLEDRLAESCEKAVMANQYKKVQALVDFARRCDEVRDTGAIHSELVDRLALTALTAHLNVAEEELKKEQGTGMKTMRVLACVRALPAFWKELDDPGDLSSRADALRTTISTRMKAAMDKYLAADDKAKVDKLIKFAGDCDPNFTGVGLPGDLAGEMKKAAIPDLDLF